MSDYTEQPQAGWYEVSYEHEGREWGIMIWAESFNDADDRLDSLAATSEILGRICDDDTIEVHKARIRLVKG